MLKNYKKLCELERRISLVQSTISILDWDQQCFMPEDGAAYRAKQRALLSGIAHQESVSSVFADALKGAEDECSAFSTEDRRLAHVRRSRREFDQHTLVPQQLVEDIAHAASEGQACWEKARARSDFRIFASSLKKTIDLVKKKAKYVQKETGSLYDELLKDFEWGVKKSFLDQTFNTMKPELMRLLEKITKTQAPHTAFTKDIYPKKAQEDLALRLAKYLGFDRGRSVLTDSAHPFSSTLGHGDYRITTRYLENDPFMAFLAIAHEMGHSLYEQGLPSNDFGTTIGQAASYGIHESQSLFLEKRIATSKIFLRQWHSEFRKAFPGTSLANMSAESFVGAALHVEPSLIRVSADEVTYCLHIIIRYELEAALIDDHLNVDEIPSLWNSKYQHYLGIQPKNDADGCLQDVHWSVGAFGYFPSYALGHLYSAQFSTAIEKSIGSLDDCIAKNNLHLIRHWLDDNIHIVGAQFDPLDLIKRVSGAELSSEHFIQYLNKKYTN